MILLSARMAVEKKNQLCLDKLPTGIRSTAKFWEKED